MHASVQRIRHWLHVISHTTGKTPSQKAWQVVGTWRLSIMRLLSFSRQLEPPGEQKLLASNSGATRACARSGGHRFNGTIDGFRFDNGGCRLREPGAHLVSRGEYANGRSGLRRDEESARVKTGCGSAARQPPLPWAPEMMSHHGFSHDAKAARNVSVCLPGICICLRGAYPYPPSPSPETERGV